MQTTLFLEPSLQVTLILLTSLILFLLGLWLANRHRLSDVAKSLMYYKKLCDELEQNTKIIIQQDLQLTRTQESLDKRVHGLYALHKISQKLASALDESTLAEWVSEGIVRELGLEKAAFFLKLREESKLLCLGQRGFPSDQILEQVIPELEELLDKNLSAFVGTLHSPDPWVNRLVSLTQLHSLLWTPIEIESTKVGGILTGNSLPHERVTQDDQDLLGLLTDQTCVAIKNIHLYEQTRQTQHMLEVRVQERTRELEELNQALKQMSDMKSDFVSAVSHELRTPLTSIQGYSSILTSGKLGSVTPEQQIRLEKIHLHANELVQMINDLLDISRIERGKVEMKREQVFLNDVLLKVLDLLQPQYLEHNFRSELELPQKIAPILGDINQLQRVFINLLGNAIKYTPDGGVITVKANQSKEEVQLDISDTGVGIPESALPKIFTEFYRVDTPLNQEKKGSGLGLSLVKKIVEAHKGTITVQSKTNKGTTFRLTLPLTQSARQKE